ncbi:hypothetical protein GCM10023078_03220 [Gibbsiella greigii]
MFFVEVGEGFGRYNSVVFCRTVARACAISGGRCAATLTVSLRITAGYDRRPCLSRLKPPSWRFRLCAVPPFGAFNGFNPRAPLT